MKKADIPRHTRRRGVAEGLCSITKNAINDFLAAHDMHKQHHKRSRKHQFIAQRRKGITTKRKKQPAAGAVGRELLYVAL